MLSIKGMEVIATAIGRNVDSPVADYPNKKNDQLPFSGLLIAFLYRVGDSNP